MLRPENFLSLSRISTVGVLCPSSYLDSCAWLMPRILANSPCVRSKPRISLILRAIEARSGVDGDSVRWVVFFTVVY